MDILQYINKMNRLYGNEPTPVRFNTQKYLQGGRVQYKPGGIVEPGVTHYARKSPTPINEETFKKIDDFVTKSAGTLSKKALGESLGYKTVEKGRTSGQGGLNKIISAWEKSRDKVFNFKPSKFTSDSPKVKQVINLFESGMTKSAIEFKTGITTKEIRNIFHQFAPEYIGDVNLPSGEGKNAVKNRRKRIIKELTDYWKDKPGGKKILEEMNQKLRGIKLKNAEIANMSDEAILNNKKFKEAMNLDVKGLKAGKEINFNRYANLTPEEYVAKVRGMATTNQFYQPEHFIAINKKNPASMLPKNIHTAVGKMGGQMEVMKNFIASNPKDKRVAQIHNLFKSQNIPVTNAPGTALSKIKSAGTTSLRGLERVAGPLGTELLYLLTGTKPDPTKSQDLLLPAFWNQIMTKYNWQDKSTDPIKRRIINMAKRGLIPTAAMPAISGIASVALGPMLIKDAAELLQSKIDEQGLTGKIEEQSGMIGDEAGASLFMEDIIDDDKQIKLK